MGVVKEQQRHQNTRRCNRSDVVQENVGTNVDSMVVAVVLGDDDDDDDDDDVATTIRLGIHFEIDRPRGTHPWGLNGHALLQHRSTGVLRVIIIRQTCSLEGVVFLAHVQSFARWRREQGFCSERRVGTVAARIG